MVRPLSATVFAFITLAGIQPTHAQEWSSQYEPGIGARTQIPGNIARANSFNIVLEGAKCDTAFPFVFTFAKGAAPELSDLENAEIIIRFNDVLRPARIMSVSPIEDGYGVAISLGFIHGHRLLPAFWRRDAMRMIVLDENRHPDQRFTPPHNSWNTEGMGEALDETYDLCTQNDRVKYTKEGCEAVLDGTALLEAYRTKTLNDVLLRARKCVAQDISLGEKAGALGGVLLHSIDEMTRLHGVPRKATARIAQGLLQIGADAGDAWSQYTLAEIYKAKTLIGSADLIAPDQTSHLYWLARSAAQKYPMALLYLGMHIGAVAADGDTDLLEMAHILLSQAPVEFQKLSGKVPPDFNRIVQEKLDLLAKRLGPDGVRRAELRRADFKYSSLIQY